ncbi:MAG: SAM-dependent methyltransferase [Sphingobacteriales bacterium]|nr:SAM-dependent methyltransferase [Sphingobacteriales bacterium]MBI3717972.1 SAM-dependent methyltransferase [Sphingobacteriales bacterium]
MNNLPAHPSSFKDPAGFMFVADGIYYRQVNIFGSEDYSLLMSSGLYEKLISKNRLIRHTEIDNIKSEASQWFKTLQPEQLPFISYPYEWSFDQLKDAALLTLTIQKEALNHGMTLKDATPFNVQWLNGKAIFIDTLSFEKHKDGEPWIAYKQFCECFLASLLLMHYRNNELNKLLVSFPNGIPTPIVSSLLPFKTKLNLNLYLHIHLQAKMQKKGADDKQQNKRSLSTTQLVNIIESLRNLIKKLSPVSAKTTWNNYYDETILSNAYLQHKQELAKSFLSAIQFNSLIDLGANKGEFSLLFKDKAAKIVAADFDAACINELYLHIKSQKLNNIFPLVIDLANPSPAIGWANEERNSFWNRVNTDVIMALALIHHLAISFNISFAMMAELFSQKTNYLLIEFVPKHDPKVQQLLSHRKDVFDHYTQTDFEQSFSVYFQVLKKETIQTTDRILYLMKTK